MTLNSFIASSKWSEDWELILNSSNPVSSVCDLGLLLNTGFNANDNVTRATRKAHGMPFYLKRSFATLTPSSFLPLYKALIRPHLEYAIQASSPILSRDCQALESVQKLAVKFDAIRLI